MPIQLSRSSPPLGAGDDVFPEDWEPVIEELPPASAEAAAMGECAPRPADAPAAVRTFHGKIESIGTLEILKALGQSRASGIVSFETNPQGALLLEDGLIVGASWGELSGARALAQLLLLEAGTFRVGAHLHEVMTEDTRAPQALLLEALHLVAQMRAISGADEGATRRLEPPSPRRFSLFGAKPSESAHPAANGKAVVAGPAAANGKATANREVISNGKAISNGNHSNGSGSNAGRNALRFLVEPFTPAVAKGNHTNGKHALAERNGRLSMTPLEQNQAPGRSVQPAAPARPELTAPARPELSPPTWSEPAAPARPELTAPTQPDPVAASPPTVSLPAGQLRSKSLWWMDCEPPAPPSGLKGETFTRRTLGRLKGAGRLLQPRK